MFKKTILTIATIATVTAGATFAMPTTEAEAAGGRRTAAFAIGAIAGLTVGAIAANRHSHRHHHYVPGPTRVYYGRPAPWSAAWYDNCSARYRSFNPHTGYYIGYDGRRHFCR
nr:BA14K family protein [uncultured Cohaesibacter sp.]